METFDVNKHVIVIADVGLYLVAHDVFMFTPQ